MRAKQWQAEVENDWILLDETDFEDDQNFRENFHKDKNDKTDKENNHANSAGESSVFFFVSAKAKQKEKEEQKRTLMALDTTDIELIRASWIPARKDPSGSGILLFKGLFTKFPEYLKLFSQFTDLDIENLHENKRLIKHAVKVIDTVTFVVDSIGDERKADQLNDALINLVRSHLKRQIGLNEFRNLGIVIIDFICDLQQRRRGPSSRARTNSSCEHSLESVGWSETETQEDFCIQCQNYHHSNNINLNNQTGGGNSLGCADSMFANIVVESSPPPSITIMDTSLLVTAWTKLYSSILDLVRREQGDTDGHL